MVINTLVNRDIIGGGAPRYFFPLIQNYDGIKQGEIIEDCQLQISVALFDKANSEAFWDLLDAIIDAVIDNRKLSTAETYDMISGNEAVSKTLLDVLSIQYLICHERTLHPLRQRNDLRHQHPNNHPSLLCRRFRAALSELFPISIPNAYYLTKSSTNLG